MLLAPLEASEQVALEDTLEAAHGVEGLRLPGGTDLDDLSFQSGEEGQQVGLDLGLELVLAALAGEDDHKGEAAAVDDRIDYGAGDLLLVGAQAEAGSVLGEEDHIEEMPYLS